jgi:hypothetical protein
MAAQITRLKPDTRLTLEEIFAELDIPFDPLPRVGDVDHWAGYRAKRAELNRATFRVV